ncbi:MAG: STAS domain-containing protein [Acidimicrobiales bacterium]
MTEPDFFRVVAQGCGRACVELRGDIDAEQAHQLGDVVCELVARVRRVEVNVAAVTFFGSAGLNALVNGLLAAREAGNELRLVALTDQVRRVLDITGLADELAPGAAAA